MSLKEKSISGFTWSFAEGLSKQAVNFVISIVLARILSPADYGLVGMIIVFVVISQTFVDSGFTQALIRKKNISQTDFSTVFYFNLTISFSIYIILFFCSGLISDFFNQPLLVDLVKVLSLTIIINSIAIVQRAKLTKDINFRLLTKISFLSNLISGIVALILALTGYGVWSLIWKTLVNDFIQALLLWIFNKWTPSLEFSTESFKEMFNFGYKLLLSSLIDNIYRNVYYFIIGKYFSAADLGLFSRADQFKKLFSQNLNTTVQRVSYPLLSSIQEDSTKLKAGYTKVLKTTVFLTSILMFGLAGISESLIMVLLGDKWIGAVEYLQLLCIVGVFYPLHALNLNILNVKGRSDLFLRLEIIKKLLAVPVILVGIYYGITEMILGMIGNSILAYFLNSRYSGKLIDYSPFSQIKDVAFSFSIALLIGVTLLLMNIFIPIPSFWMLTLQVSTGLLILLSLGELIKFEEYAELKSILLSKIGRRKK